MNVTFDLDEADLVVIGGRTSTPEHCTEAPSLPPSQPTSLKRRAASAVAPPWIAGLSRSVMQRAGLTPRRVPRRGATKEPPKAPEATQEAPGRMSFTPQRVPRRGASQNNDVIVAPVADPLEERMSFTPQRVARRGPEVTDSKSTAAASVVTKETLERAGLTPRRVPVLRGVTASPVADPQAPNWTKAALERAGLTPRRIPMPQRSPLMERNTSGPFRRLKLQTGRWTNIETKLDFSVEED